jgi:hypothetical protein
LTWYRSIYGDDDGVLIAVDRAVTDGSPVAIFRTICG